MGEPFSIMKQELKIIILVAAAFGVGIAVLIANPDYRVTGNLASNHNYYPAVGDSAGHAPPGKTPVPSIPSLPELTDNDVETAIETGMNDLFFDYSPEPFPDRNIDF